MKNKMFKIQQNIEANKIVFDLYDGKKKLAKFVDYGAALSYGQKMREIKKVTPRKKK